ncbi:MAG: DUF3343 domain-containing protein [Clostridia bacterium]|nr:DUF3343 domain-containing protein [Clostridia bacterium]
MIRRTMRLVITFRTTAEAMAMERVCREQQADGRLIPVPRSISAGCGLAWCAAPQSEEALMQLMREHGVACEAVYSCLV